MRIASRFGLLFLSAFALLASSAHAATTLTVMNNADSGAGSLRAQLAAAAAGDTIVFDDNAFASATTIQLASTLTIAQPITLTGPGANKLIIAGTGTDSVTGFRLIDASALPAGTLSISGIGLTAGGSGTTAAGSVLNFSNSGTLSLTACEVFGSFGLALVTLNSSTAANITGCTFRTNRGSTTTDTLFIRDIANGVILTNTTFADNNGRNIHVFPMTLQQSITLTNCTVLNAALYNVEFESTAQNIVADLSNNLMAYANQNVHFVTAQPFGTSLVSHGYNLFDDNSSTLTAAGHDLVNASSLAGTVGLYGGTVQTVPLLPGSSAIDSVPPAANILATDQRGKPRGLSGDIGAFESQGFTMTYVTGNQQAAPLNTAFPQPLCVQLSSSIGEPVAGGVVAYIKPQSGASLVVAGNQLIDNAGIASLRATANGIAGEYLVGTQCRGALNTILFSLENGTLSVGYGVDTDGDGYSDSFETVAGTMPNSYASSPNDNTPVNSYTIGQLGLTKIGVKLNFAKADSDSITFSGLVSIPADFAVLNQHADLDVAGVTKSFVLDAKGSAKVGGDSFKVTIKAKKGAVAAQNAKYSVKLLKGHFQSPLDTNGMLSNATLSKVPRSLVVSLVFAGHAVHKTQGVVYTSKMDKTGMAK